MPPGDAGRPPGGGAGRAAKADPGKIGTADDCRRYHAPQHLPLRRQLERLHRLGAHPTGELIFEALRRLSDPDRAAVLDLLERIVEWSPEAIEALGARDFPPAPLLVIRRAA